MRYLRAETVEQRAEQRLAELARLLGQPPGLPTPIDLLAEQILGLDFLWEPIDELPGETILAGLLPERRLIVLNERRRDLFAAHPGLERFTKGHEMGHWDLFVDRGTLDHRLLPGLDRQQAFVLRRSPVGQVQVLRALRRPAAVSLAPPDKPLPGPASTPLSL